MKPSKSLRMARTLYLFMGRTGVTTCRKGTLRIINGLRVWKPKNLDSQPALCYCAHELIIGADRIVSLEC